MKVSRAISGHAFGQGRRALEDHGSGVGPMPVIKEDAKIVSAYAAAVWPIVHVGRDYPRVRGIHVVLGATMRRANRR